MSAETLITREYFIKRFAALCLRSGMTGFPKDELDQHILLKSIVLTIDPSGTYTQQEIDEKIKYWINRISQIQKLDHSSVRRWLVDGGHLTRNADGSCYQVVVTRSRPPFFEEAVAQIDLLEVVKTAQEEIAKKKLAYLEKSGAQPNK